MRARIGPSTILSKPDRYLKEQNNSCRDVCKTGKEVDKAVAFPLGKTLHFVRTQKREFSVLKRLPVLSKALLSSGDISQRILYSENLWKECRNDRLLRTKDWQF